MSADPVLCVVHVTGTDYVRTSPSDATLWLIRLNFQASCIDADDRLVPYQVDENGLPTYYYFEGFVELDADETDSSKRTKLEAAALGAFSDPVIPVLFV